MTRAIIGGLSTHGELLVQGYHDAYFPNAKLEIVDAGSVRKTMQGLIKNDNAGIIILNDKLYKMCLGLCDRVLQKEKVYRYQNDTLLEQYLISKFGILESQKAFYEKKLERLLAEIA